MPKSHIMAVVASAFHRSRAEYGERYDDHVLDQYRLFVDTEERLVSRRQNENRFFLSLNAFILAVLSLLLQQGINDRIAWVGPLLLGVAGAVLSGAWFLIIRSYRKLNTAKFAVISQFEEQLPVKMFDAEWMAALSADYQPFTTIQSVVPVIFGLLALAGAVVGGLGLGGCFEPR